MNRRILITGHAGFIGFHLARRLLDEGVEIHGFDALTDYYDPALKRAREAMLAGRAGFSATHARLEDMAALWAALEAFRPDVIIHLAAQAGVRYSLEAPRSYIDSNIVGTFNLMEGARRLGVSHLLMASTSSVYGASPDMPFREADPTDRPLTIYAATKKATEAMAHSYAHLWNLPTTMFRFFTVYGSWGRPDLAYVRFARAMLNGEPIDVYNAGEMHRDFTFVGDLVEAIRRLIDVVPVRPASPADIMAGDSLSPVAPFRIVNIGNGKPVKLTAFIAALEAALGVTADKRLLPMQKGDVPATWADCTLLERLTGYRPSTDIRDGLLEFVDWYRAYADGAGA